MTKPLALMDINVSLPASCSFEFHCHKNNKQSRMEEVAAFIEGLSSECLTKHEENKIHAQLRSKEPLSAPIHPECRIILDYTQENYFARMREAAALVSDIYSTFHQLSMEEIRKLGKAGLDLSVVRQDVTDLQISNFKNALMREIESELCSHKRSVSLETDNCPLDILKEVARRIFKDLDLSPLFPYNIHTTVKDYNSTIVIDMQLVSHY